MMKLLWLALAINWVLTWATIIRVNDILDRIPERVVSSGLTPKDKPLPLGSSFTSVADPSRPVWHGKGDVK